MEKTYQAIMQAMKLGCSVKFTPTDHQDVTQLEIMNKKNSMGHRVEFTIIINDIEIRDNAVSEMINKAVSATY